MTDPNSPENIPPSSSSSTTKVPPKIRNGFSGEKVRFPKLPDTDLPDEITLRENMRFAIRQWSRMYSHAWGTAVLAGVSFFALGWLIKGSNPLPSLIRHDDPPPPQADDADK